MSDIFVADFEVVSKVMRCQRCDYEYDFRGQDYRITGFPDHCGVVMEVVTTIGRVPRTETPTPETKP